MRIEMIYYPRCDRKTEELIDRLALFLHKNPEKKALIIVPDQAQLDQWKMLKINEQYCTLSLPTPEALMGCYYDFVGIDNADQIDNLKLILNLGAENAVFVITQTINNYRMVRKGEIERRDRLIDELQHQLRQIGRQCEALAEKTW